MATFLCPQGGSYGEVQLESQNNLVYIMYEWKGYQGAKEIIFTGCHLGKLKLAFTSPDVNSTSPKSFWFHSSFVIQVPQKNITILPIGQVKKRIH